MTWEGRDGLPATVSTWERAVAMSELGQGPLPPATEAKRHRVHVAVECVYKFPRALQEVARVSEWGDAKHEQPLGSKSYLEVPDADTTYLDAEARHMIAEAIEGPVNEADNGMLHKAQKAWSALADLEVFLRDREKETGDV